MNKKAGRRRVEAETVENDSGVNNEGSRASMICLDGVNTKYFVVAPRPAEKKSRWRRPRKNYAYFRPSAESKMRADCVAARHSTPRTAIDSAEKKGIR